MYKIRTTKTGSGNTEVQVVVNTANRVNVDKHIGIGRNTQEIEELKRLASKYIDKLREDGGETSIFKESNLVCIDNISIVRTLHTFAYEFLAHIYTLNGFDKLNCNILKDLSIMRIIEPESKEESIKLLNEFFEISYSSGFIHGAIEKLPALKDDIESVAVEYAKSNFSFDFSLVFYDVSTLYFESFNSDEFRKPGFSKKGKSQQPQVVFGFVVTKEGYPIAIESFEGSKFEEYTIIPAILDLKKRYNIETLTVVADAGMISFDNMSTLRDNGLSFIVGARVRNTNDDVIKDVIDKLGHEENKYVKSMTEEGLLICDYSKKRASRDKAEREKQIRKDTIKLKTKGRFSARRSRFIKEVAPSKYILNEDLIESDRLKDGIKGYYTNLEGVPEELVASRYHDLWHVEKSFKIAKSELKSKPMSQKKKEMILSHVLIVFVSLCISKTIEIKTNYSIKDIREAIWDIQDAVFVDKLTRRSFTKRMKFPDSEIYSKLSLI